MADTSYKGRKVKHRLTGQVGIIVGLTHYSKAEREGEFRVKWLKQDGSIRDASAHRCEFEFVQESR